MNNIEVSGITSKIITEAGKFFLVIRPLDEKTNKYSKDDVRFLIRDEFIKKQVMRTFVKGYKLYLRGKIVNYQDNSYPLVTFVEVFDHQLREEVVEEYRRVEQELYVPIIPIKK